MFQHEEKKWAERGVGSFKLNVTRKVSDEGNEDGDFKARARFIMRTQYTFKVILNAPIFKEMKITDQQGNGSPTGKVTAFSVLIDGKAVPHMLRVSNP